MQRNEKEVVPLANVFTPLPMPPAQGEPHKYYSTVRLRHASGLWTKKKGQDNRMGKILEAFLTDQLRVDDVTEQRTPKHQRLCESTCELQDQLSEKLNAEDKETLNELVDTIFDEGCVDAEKKFERGYRLDVLMTAEIFIEWDIFLRKGEQYEYFKRVL